MHGLILSSPSGQSPFHSASNSPHLQLLPGPSSSTGKGKASEVSSCQWVLCEETLKGMPAEVRATWAFTYGNSIKGHSGSSGWESETYGINRVQLTRNSESIGHIA